MSDEYHNFPDQKELEKEIGDYLSRKYGRKVKIVTAGLYPLADKEDGETAVKTTIDKAILDFDVTPEELVSYLDEYVIKQDAAKTVLATKICTHFHRIKYAIEHSEQAKRNVGQIKSNVLLIGSTGVGKTYLVKLIAKRLGVPFVKGDATKFSETGYVGGDVEDLVRDLVRQAGGDIERAQYGIIYLDEIDKIASSQYRLGADVSRTGVQRALLKPMEETEVDLKIPHDPVSQIEAIEHFRATGKREKRVINTKNILFIMSGAFTGLDEIVKKRVQLQSMGFEGTIHSKKDTTRFLKQVKSEDLIQFGFESEFVGRLPVIAVLDELTADDYFEILINPNSTVVVAKKQDFKSYGIKILFEDEAFKEIADMAAREGTGARGLVSVMEKTLLEFEKKLPSTDIKYLAVSPEIVHHPREELEKLLKSSELQKHHEERFKFLAHVEYKRLVDFIQRTLGDYLETHDMLPTVARIALMAQQCQSENSDPRDVCDHFIDLIKTVDQYAEKISKNCGIKVVFDEDAIDRILSKHTNRIVEIEEICRKLLHAFEYGLRLLSQKRGVEKVTIPAEGVDYPENFINKLVGEMFKVE